MNNINHPLLQSLVGETVKSVRISTGHGEIVKIEFQNGATLDVCTYDPSCVRRGDRKIDELYVGIDNVEL